MAGEQCATMYVHSGVLETAGIDLASSTWVGDDGGKVPPFRETVKNSVDYYKKYYKNVEASTWVRKN